MAETLEQERRYHLLMLSMANFCGQPTNSPGGLRATSNPRGVNCPDCLRKMAELYPSFLRSGGGRG